MNYVRKSTLYKDRELAFNVFNDFIPTLSSEQVQYFKDNQNEIREWIEIYLTNY